MASIPNVDFSRIPAEYRCEWVVVRLGADQQVLAHAKTAQAAIQLCNADPADPMIALTQVPDVPAAAWVRPAD